MIVNKGFTLIEILIVIIIIGITVGFAMISFGDFGASRRILFSAEQLVHTVRLAQQQAILENSTLGLNVNNHSYQILRFENSSTWGVISKKGIFKINYFPQDTVINLRTQNKPAQGAPPIVLSSSGDMTPFTLTFGTNREPVLTILTGTQDGKLTFIPANNK
jgi:general secretion pathway protein H